MKKPVFEDNETIRAKEAEIKAQNIKALQESNAELAKLFKDIKLRK